MSSLPASAIPTASKDSPHSIYPDDEPRAPRSERVSKTVLIVVPTLDGGAADAGAVELVRILAGAGASGIVRLRGRRVLSHVTGCGWGILSLAVSCDTANVMLLLGMLLV